MPKALLDTDILSEVLKGKDQAISERAIAYQSVHDRLATSVVTVAEIIKGLHKKGREDAINSFTETLQAIEVFGLDEQAAILAGRIYAELEKSGKPIGRADPFVAAIAITNGMELVTGNTRHFQYVVDVGFHLNVVNWRS